MAARPSKMAMLSAPTPRRENKEKRRRASPAPDSTSEAGHSSASGWMSLAVPMQTKQEPDTDTETVTRPAKSARQTLGKKAAKEKWSPCLICLKTPSQQEWYHFENKQPVGNGCKLHYSVVAIAFPHLSFAEAAELYHAPTEDGRAFKLELNGAVQVFVVLLEKGIPLILPESQVDVAKSYVVEHYFKYLFLTDSDVQRLFNTTPRALKMGKPSSLRLEDGSAGCVHGWYVNPIGLDPAHALGLRKVRVSTSMATRHSDHLLSPSTQMRPNQATDVLNLALARSKDARNTAERCAGRSHVVTMEALFHRATALLEVEEEKEAAASAMEEEQNQNEGDESGLSEQEEGGDDGETAAPVPVFQFGALVDQAAALAKKKPSKKKKKEAADDSEILELDGDGGDDVWKEIEHDSLLRQVAKQSTAAGSSAPFCLLGLIPSRTFDGNQKVGHQLKGAKTLLKRLQSTRSSAAALLEQRIEVIERCQIIMFKPIKSLPRAELTSHLDAIKKMGLDVCQPPLKVLLDLLERQTDDRIGDYFATPPTVARTELQKMIDTTVDVFHVFKPLEGDLDLLTVTGRHALDAGSASIKGKVSLGNIPEAEGEAQLRQAWQALAECMVDSYGCPSFLAALTDPTKNRHRLLALLEEFASMCEACEKHKEENPHLFAEAEGQGAVLDFAVQKIHKVTKGLLALLSIQPNFKNSTAADANYLRNYNGKSLLEASVRDLLKANPTWTSWFDELVAKGAGSMTLAPEIALMMETLQDTGTQLNGTFLAQSSLRLPVLKKQTRAGTTTGLEKLLYKRCVAAAQDLDTMTKLDLSFLDGLNTALSLFKETPGVLQLLSKLDSYRRQHIGQLALAEIMSQLAAYPTNMQADIPDDGFWPVLQQLVKAVRMIDELDETVSTPLRRALCWQFRVLHFCFQDDSDDEKKYRSCVAYLKELVGRCPDGAMHRGVPDLFTKTELTWMTCTLDSFVASKDFNSALKMLVEVKSRNNGQEEKTRAFESLLRAGACLQGLAAKLAKLEPDLASDGISQWSLLPKITSLLKDHVFSDALDLHMAALLEGVAEGKHASHLATGGIHDPASENFWKCNLNSQAPWADVLAAAQVEGSLTSVDGTKVEEAMQKFQKALDECSRFQKLSMAIAHVAEHDMWSDVKSGHAELSYMKAFKAEGLLAMALAQVKAVGVSPATLRWGKSIIREVLADISGQSILEFEDNIHPTLLAEGRAFMGNQ